ncbi:MAG: histidine phosphatase family protein [Ardenticatenaceae bacterium]|nr:histidine phosphatase family protein [Anaerolineales bacterium]MCB8922218.1 histidine phosphatase family protein [Ardenticatenaceae bacterium]
MIRHAQSENNALWARTESSNGRSPDPLLTETGQQQAEHLARYIANHGNGTAVSERGQQHNRDGYHFTHLYTSLMQRAIATGSAIAAQTNLPLVVWEIVHEFGGIYEQDHETDERIGLPGPNRAFFEAHYPQLVLPDSLGDEGWWQRPYEPLEETMIRAKTFLAELQQRHEPVDQVAIITHGGFFTAVVRTLLGFSTLEKREGENRIWLHANNTSITRLDFDDDHVELVYLNRLDHLPTHLIT